MFLKNTAKPELGKCFYRIYYNGLYFSATGGFYENLEILLDFVSKPYLPTKMLRRNRVL